MIPALVAAIVTGCATAALPALIRHTETRIANHRLAEAHRTATERTKP